MNSHALEIGVVLLQLQALSRILAVLGGDVTRHAGNTAFLLLSTLKDNLYSIAFYFLCHNVVPL